MFSNQCCVAATTVGSRRRPWHPRIPAPGSRLPESGLLLWRGFYPGPLPQPGEIEHPRFVARVQEVGHALTRAEHPAVFDDVTLRHAVGVGREELVAAQLEQIVRLILRERFRALLAPHAHEGYS